MKNRSLTIPLQTSLTYAIIGFLWIFFSDKVLSVFVTNIETFNTLQTYKGWFFVSFTALLLFSLLRNRLNAFDREHNERERAEYAVVENEKLLSAMVDSAMDAIILVNENLSIILFNRAAENIFKFSTNQAIGKSFTNFIPKRLWTKSNNDNVDTTETAFISLLLNPQNITAGVRADGTEFPIEASVTQIDLKGQRLFNIILRDITDKIHSEYALRESEQRFSKAFHANPAAVIITRITNGEVIDVNQSYLDILEFTREELHDATKAQSSIFNNPSERQEIVLELEQFGFVRNYETTLRTKSGNIRYVLFSIEKIELSKESCMLSIFFDVTETKLAEAEILKLNSELEHRVQKRTEQLEIVNRELESFSYSVSHDLRAPLRGIDSWSKVLLEDHKNQLNEEGIIYLNKVRSETQRMGQLIDDLLKLSRISQTEKRKTIVDLTTITKNIFSRLEESEPNRSVQCIIPDELTTIGDPYLLENAMTNLLSNAFKFTGKSINAKIEIGVIKEDQKSIFFIRDNGAGFDMKYSNKLFGAFQRLHTSTEFPGTGIGLATVQRIIQHHGGKIWAESAINEGATFYFTIDDNN